MKRIILLLALYSLSTQASEQEAMKAIKSLGQSLKKELKMAMKKSPSHAVSVCNTQAMKVTKAAAKKAIAVGRVSLKNRNPNNLPKDWMSAFVEKYHEKKIKKPYVVVDITKNKKGILKPIKTGPLCLKCHGSNIDSLTEAKINSLYPNDKAVGYKVGEIRGFFWAEYSN